MQNFEIQGQLLEVKTGDYNGSPYASLKLRSSEVADNSILKYKIDVKKVNVPELDRHLDEEVVLRFQVSKGQNDAAILKVVGVVTA